MVNRARQRKRRIRRKHAASVLRLVSIYFQSMGSDHWTSIGVVRAKDAFRMDLRREPVTSPALTGKPRLSITLDVPPFPPF